MRMNMIFVSLKLYAAKYFLISCSSVNKIQEIWSPHFKYTFFFMGTGET